MSIDFTFVFSCEPQPMGDAILNVARVMHAKKFRRDGEVLVSDSHEESREQSIDVSNLKVGLAKLANWNSVYIEFGKPEIRLGIQFDGDQAILGTMLVFISKRSIYRLHSKEVPLDLYDIIRSVGDTVRCKGGYGGFQAEEIAKPDEFISFLSSTPESIDSGAVPDIMFFRKENLPIDKVERSWPNNFLVFEKSGYVFCIDHQFITLSKEFGMR